MKSFGKKKRCGFDIFTEHDDVEEFETHLAGLKASTIVNDKTESKKEIAFIKQRIKHILENEKLSLDNIF